MTVAPSRCLYISGIKEVHFFDAVGLDGGYVFNLHNATHWCWYWSHFKGGAGKIRGDMTPAYSALAEDRVSQIASCLPQARFTYSIRSPLERAWSVVRHRLWYGEGVQLIIRGLINSWGW